MTWSWFDLAWPWIGSAAALVLLILLFGSNLFRSDLSIVCWRDRVWLSWLSTPIYMIHNIEEYGVDLAGRAHNFPDALCASLGLPSYPGCPLPPLFFLAVNISLIWIAAPLCGFFSRRHPLVGLGFYGVIFINGIVHVAPMLLGRGYNPGAASAAVLFLPSSLWVAANCFGPGRMDRSGLIPIIGTGAIVHIVLISSVFAFIGGKIDASMLVAVQIVNSALLLFVPWIGERALGVTYRQAAG